MVESMETKSKDVVAFMGRLFLPTFNFSSVSFGPVIGHSFYKPRIIGLICMLGLVMLTGCSGPHSVYRPYDGPLKPLEQVAVLMEAVSVSVKILDGNKVHPFAGERPRLLSSGDYSREIHLIPGEHDVTFKVWIDRPPYGDRTIVRNIYTVNFKAEFKKGHVYELDTQRAPKFILVDRGTIYEFANEKGGKEGMPEHWHRYRPNSINQ